VKDKALGLLVDRAATAESATRPQCSRGMAWVR
jgi:hypothetical protein